MDDPAAGPLARRYRLPPAYLPVLADPDDVRYQAFNGVEIVRAGRWLAPLAEAFRTGEAPPRLPWAPEGRADYGWSVVACLPGAMGDPGTAATGAVMRPATLDRYAREAGFRSVEILPLRTQAWQFYRLIP